MVRNNITIKELGLYKTRIANALLKSENIMNLMFGDISEIKSKDLFLEFNNHVNSHLFIDDTIKDTSTFIFFDAILPIMRPQVKNIRIYIYAICHRDILENYTKEGYYGNRADILSEMIEETLLDENIVKEFGIGDLELDSVDIYNTSTFYGRILTFNVNNFR